MNMKCKNTLLAMLVLATGINQALADPVTVNITGTVIASACSVDTASSNLNVNLGTNIQASALATAGSGSTMVPFQLKLKDCPASTTRAIATFAGTADSSSVERYASTGSAQNVAVEVYQTSSGYKKGPGSTITQNIDADHTATFALQTRAYANGAVTPGSINATMQVEFTYQ